MTRDVQIDVRSAMIAATSKTGSQAAVEQAMTSAEWSTDTSLTKNNEKIMKMQRQDSVPRPTVRAIVPQQARGRVVPQWHKTAIKFHRIRCTICFTSPDNHQKKETPHLKVVSLPGTCIMT